MVGTQLKGFLVNIIAKDLLPLQVDTNPNGTVRYCDFLDKFGGMRWTKITKNLERSRDMSKTAESDHQ